jgi:hypothetical protein
MFKLQVLFPIWSIDYETFRGKDRGFVLSFGPFDSEQQARWFWLTMKEKLQRNYEVAVIVDNDGNECYIDEMGM